MTLAVLLEPISSAMESAGMLMTFISSRSMPEVSTMSEFTISVPPLLRLGRNLSSEG